MSKNEYKLYAAALNQENIKLAENKRFSRITQRYILIFDNGEKPEKSGEITKDEYYRLTSEDKVWLADCLLKIVADNMTTDESFQDKLSTIEEALEAERKRLKGDTNNAG